MNRIARTAAITATATVTAALLALGGAAPAFASTLGSDTDSTSTADTSATDTTSTTQPGTLSMHSSSVRPGQTVSFDGSCATSTGPDYPTISSVTSSAFASVSMGRTNPDAFDGTATIASGATAGTHAVTAHCSDGAVSSSIVVIGNHVTPDHGGGTTGGGSHTSSSSSSSTGIDTQVDTLVDQAGSALPWVLGGIVLTALAGGGAYALGRGRREDRAFEADRRARQDREAYEAWQRQQGPRGPMSYR